MEAIIPGSLLIADPFLKDPNFLRTTVFICDHQPEGSLGFVLNRQHPEKIGDLIAEIAQCDFPVYYGGPVQVNTVHFLHQCPDVISGGIEITDGIFWGGEFKEVIDGINNQAIAENQIRFFLGYSGWGENQLKEEMEEKTWLSTNGNKKLVFHKNANLIWADSLKQIGGAFTQLIHYPIDPQLN